MALSDGPDTFRTRNASRYMLRPLCPVSTAITWPPNFIGRFALLWKQSNPATRNSPQIPVSPSIIPRLIAMPADQTVIHRTPQDMYKGHTNLVTWTLHDGQDDHKPVLIDASNPDRFVTRTKARELVASLASNLTLRSTTSSITVCLHLANDILYPVLVLAILASGCRWTGTNPAYTAAELEHHFRTSETKCVITSCEHLTAVQEAMQKSGTDAEVILFDDLLLPNDPQVAPPPATGNNNLSGAPFANSRAMRTLRDLQCSGINADLFELTKAIPIDSIAALSSTSGTSGLPKVAARTHQAMMTEQAATEDNNADKPYEVRRLYCVPCFHAFAAPEMLFNALRLGQVSYFMKRYDDTFAQKVHDFQITETFGAPPMLLRLVNMPDVHPLLQSLRLVAFGGAPLVPELRRKFQDIFQVKPRIVPVYGMTEGGWYTTLKFPEEDESGSLGRAVPGVEVKIVSRPDTKLDSGFRVGEVHVRGPQIMTGYLNNEVATDETLQDGWLKTGDIGYLHEGKVHLVDRAKDLIKVNGWQVAPAELENALLQQGGVLDAAVLAFGEDVDEHPLACVIASRSTVTKEEVKANLRKLLASYKVSKTEVRFVQSIPKSPAGKILKKILKEQMTASNDGSWRSMAGKDVSSLQTAVEGDACNRNKLCSRDR